ncbi:hypothetical protein LTR02_009845 [Friedmanniomyces endolithicus]|uniref:NADP-dependent oxidoreductase domain-containing protein n=1 Tax=Friedmanniomyces endolithicus TaxID=329885 RepID=A0A4U0TXM0_9PEZI|nr:hypothetical protein LTS09_016984 [Friedmanniomyces endolithicus]KAK0337158.1 hypothetical protein LTR94_005824 [Friedmanniomyces endolithicus]KAK0782381.1 hypothetical protein LTR59_012181 [Friedmanniomyces endolithicus]KAK0787423.1 hypothetical protein LTR38_011677 [Friedmanniomyces endolithicus]KAK0798736.1 hypothetical protein LTR75_009446 [Friedmanniomyces endolithicus]
MALNLNSTLKMPSGYEIPMLGYGVYQTPEAVAEDVTHHAIASGYRHVDSATVYRNEAPSATGMMKAGIPREQLFYTSKIPPNKINYKDAKACVEESLKKTQLKYIDLYLLHAPYGGKEGRLGAWRALVEAVNEGKVRSIGVSNYGVHHLEELDEWQKKQPKEKAGVLSVNQVELHPWLARPDIVSWCQEHSVVVEAYSPLVRSTRMEEPVLVSLAKKHGKTAAQILLRWGLQKGFVILPKSVTHSRIEENTKLYDFELDASDMKELEMGTYKPCTWDPTIAPLSD